MEVSTAKANATGKKLCVHRELREFRVVNVPIAFFFSVENMWFDFTIVLFGIKNLSCSVSISASSCLLE